MSDGEQGPGESLIAHLLELRNRLLRAVLAVVVAFCALLPFSDRLYTAISEPLLRSLPKGGQLIAIEVTSTFFVPMKLAFFAALMLAMPVVLYQLWAFVAPGLYDKEKKLARPILIAATLLFYAGCAFTYYLLLPVMFAYLSSTAPAGVTMMTDISHYLDFVLVMFLAGGVSFEVPVAVMIAVILGWVTPKQLSEWRGYIIVAIFIVAAIITPPDGLSQIMLAVPMCLLYEAGVLMARLMRKRAEAAGPVAP
jgi:sec-independent protein translocase protein TatC